MARRPERTLTIAAALDAVAKYEKAADARAIDSATPILDRELTYTYISPAGKRIGVSRENLTGQIEGWPLPGDYEIDVVDSNGESIPDEPWRATEFDKDSLLAVKTSGDNPANGLMSSIMEESRIIIRDQRIRINQAEARETKAREDLTAKIDLINDLQKKKNDAELAAGKAIADRDLANEKQKEAEAALAYLEDSMASMKPHIAMAVDHGLQRFGELLGATEPDAAPSETEPPPAQDGEDPPPAGVDDRAKLMNDLLAAVIIDESMLMELTHRGVIPWAQARALYWLIKKKDIGEEPNWDEFFGADDSDHAGGA